MEQAPTQSIIQAALREVGVSAGDTVLVHSDSTLAMQLSGADNWSDALAFQLDAFLDILGPSGTLIVPTFNYDFCEGKPYDHDSSPSQVGMFSNFLLNRPESVRSFHPIFSFAAIGEKAHEICGDVSRSSFGADSIFERLHKMDAGIVFFNVPFLYCTFVHYVEQAHGVDYRYLKEFSGTMARSRQTFNETVDSYVRYLGRNVKTSLGRLEDRLRANGLIHVATPGGGTIKQARSGDVFRESWNLLDEDPHSLLETPPTLS